MQITALWRHPIKSHGREAIDQVTLSKGQTMPWDRTWAVTHDASKFDGSAPEWVQCGNFMRGARTPAIAAIWATLNEADRQITLRHADLDEITFCPDAPEDVARFMRWVAPLCPDHRAMPADIIAVPGRGMTDSAFPSISLMNEASHRAVTQALGTAIDTERWRGNIWFDSEMPWVEFDWMNRSLRLGGCTLLVRERITRCMVTNTNTHTGLRDTPILDTLNQAFGHQDFGIYAEVIEGGDIAIGDKLEVL